MSAVIQISSSHGGGEHSCQAPQNIATLACTAFCRKKSCTAAGTGGWHVRDGFQREGYIANRVESLVGIFLQAASHYSFEGGRYSWIGFRQRRRIPIQNGLDGVGCGLSLECSFARKHFVNDGARGKDVGPLVDGQAANLLWWHVSDRAHHDSGTRSSCQRSGVGESRVLRTDEFGQAEIENL